MWIHERYPLVLATRSRSNDYSLRTRVSKGDHASLAVMLNAEVPFERLLVFNFSHRLAIEVSLDVRTLADHLKHIPFLGLEHPLGPFLVFSFLALGRVEPSAHPYTVNTARFGLVDFALVALWFALTSNELEAQSELKPL